MGAAAKRIDMLALDAQTQNEVSDRWRTAARIRAIAIIRRVEHFVQFAIDDGVLRGLSKLGTANGDEPIVGARVGSRKPNGEWDIDAKFDSNGGMAINQKGELIRVFRKPGSWKYTVEPVQDSALRAEDMEAYVSAARDALVRHTARADRTAKNYARICDLAERIGQSLGPKI